MRSSVGRLLAIAVVVTVSLGSLVILHFGTDWGWHNNLFQVAIGIVVIAGLLFGYRADRHGRLGTVVVVGGFLLFAMGVYGGAVACTEQRYGPEATHGMTYDWQTNQLQFGDHTDTEEYRCEGTPNRGAVFTGYLLIVGGIVRYFDRVS